MRSGTLMIGIAGGTGSGKTTLVRKLGERFGSSVSVVCHDWYYRAQNGLSLEERARQNYDRPEAFETDLLVRDLLRLRNGHAVDCPQYDYTLHNRSQTTVRVEPASVIVVEGILIFADPELRDLFDIRIFVDTDADIRILRRLSRDVKERGRQHRLGLSPVRYDRQADARGICRTVKKIRPCHCPRGRRKPCCA